MKNFFKKCANKSAHIPVYTAGGLGQSMKVTGKLLFKSGSYISKKSDAMHTWIDETIEIGKEEINKKENK